MAYHPPFEVMSNTTNQITHFDLSLLVGTQHFTTLPNSFQTYFHHFKTTIYGYSVNNSTEFTEKLSETS
jgi:hypothetical protein